MMMKLLSVGTASTLSLLVLLFMTIDKEALAFSISPILKPKLEQQTSHGHGARQLCAQNNSNSRRHVIQSKLRLELLTTSTFIDLQEPDDDDDDINTSQSKRAGTATKTQKKKKMENTKASEAATADADATGSSGGESDSVRTASVFNGGKMEHIFEMTPFPGATHNQCVYSPKFSSSDAQDAFEKSNNIYWKIDGSCALIRWTKPDYDVDRDADDTDDGVLELYQRQDTRGQDPTPDLIPLPSRIDDDDDDGTGKNMICTNTNAYKNHNYYMKKVELNGKKDGKKQKTMKLLLLKILNDNRTELIKAVQKYGSSDGYLSVELVGHKFNQTPGVYVDAAIIIHQEQRLKLSTTSVDGDETDIETFPRTFDGIKTFLMERFNVEGVVVEYSGVYWKILSNVMDPEKCPFKIDPSNALPPTKMYTVKS
jgi:hypothetical protein